MCCFRRPPRQRRGFALMELLTVLALMAVLAGLLFPALSAARERARQATCTSNLRQIGLAARMYMDDYGDRPHWFQGLVETGYLRSPAVLLCPDDPIRGFGSLWANMFRPPQVAPETAPRSYYSAFEADWSDWEWRELLRAGGASGIAACPLHGDRRSVDTWGPLRYEGLVLRLQLDGAVVRRQIIWERSPGGITTANPWRYLSDAPVPPQLQATEVQP